MILQQEEILQVEAELIEKEELLNDNIKEIAELDETLLLLDDERKILHSEMGEFGRVERLRRPSDCNHRPDVTKNLSELDINSNPTNTVNDTFPSDGQGMCSARNVWSIFFTE